MWIGFPQFVILACGTSHPFWEAAEPFDEIGRKFRFHNSSNPIFFVLPAADSWRAFPANLPSLLCGWASVFCHLSSLSMSSRSCAAISSCNSGGSTSILFIAFESRVTISDSSFRKCPCSLRVFMRLIFQTLDLHNAPFRSAACWSAHSPLDRLLLLEIHQVPGHLLPRLGKELPPSAFAGETRWNCRVQSPRCHQRPLRRFRQFDRCKHCPGKHHPSPLTPAACHTRHVCQSRTTRSPLASPRPALGSVRPRVPTIVASSRRPS